MSLTLAASAAGAGASAASAGDQHFAPPEGAKFRHVIVEERDDGPVHRRFSSERTISFRARPTGYLAVVTIISNTQNAGQSGVMFVAAMAALKDRPIRLTLDHAGMVETIEDEAAIWEALCRSLETATGTNAARRAHAAGYISPLRALPPERRRAMLGSLLAPIIAGPLVAEGRHAVSLPARGIDGASTLLAGTQTRHAEAGGTIAIETMAAGDIPTPGDAGVIGHVVVSTQRRIDPRTGLVLESRETRDTWIGAGKTAAHDIARTTHLLTPAK